MTLRQWHDRLKSALSRQGLPLKRIDRLIDELTDHALDLFLEENSMDAEQKLESRLGSPEAIAVAAGTEFKKRTFAGRHPIFTFIMGPIIAIVVTMVVTFQMATFVYWGIELTMGGNLSLEFRNRFFQISCDLVRFVPFLVSTWLIVKLGLLSGRQKWSVIGFAIIVVSAFLLTSNFTPKTEAAPGQWKLMFGISTNMIYTTSINHVLQAVVPLLLGLWMYRKTSLMQHTHSVTS